MAFIGFLFGPKVLQTHSNHIKQPTISVCFAILEGWVNYHNVKWNILSRNTMLLSLIFYTETTKMRIVQLGAVNSPAHIEWDTLSHFLPPDIWNLTHLTMLSTNLFPVDYTTWFEISRITNRRHVSKSTNGVLNAPEEIKPLPLNQYSVCPYLFPWT